MKDYKLNKYWMDLSPNLGGVYPYYNIEKTDLFSLRFSDVIEARRSKAFPVELDSSALVTKFCLPYLLGNRTLIEGVLKAPWMSEYQGSGQWQPHQLPKHGNINPNKETFTLKLKNALINEADNYISGQSNIGILLSGGMDSRVLAGVLRELQIRKDSNFNVIALTWGAKESRDVIYAHRIAKQFDWDIVHYPLTAETLARNITYAGQHGSEFSAFHLHAMEEVSNTSGIDVIIAGSYGDSVGRAEFSGTHVTELKSIIPKKIDPFGFFKKQALKEAQKDIKIDLIDSPHFEGAISTLRKREIEQEMHYMRRMLQACMQTISIKIPIYQLFTDPNVFGLMWSLDPSIRNNDWYTLLLSELPGDLLQIPWARNGKRYHKADEKALDDFPKSYHQYGKWFRNDLKEEVLKRVFSERIYGLDIFNDQGIDRLISNWSKANTQGINKIDESVAWLCSLHDMLEIYDIDKLKTGYKSTKADKVRCNIGNIKAQAFMHVRNRIRK